MGAMGLAGPGMGPGARRRRMALVEPAVLAALAGRSAHGYDLRRAVEEMTGGTVIVDPGSLYRLLRQLEHVGAVESAWSDGDFGPQRRDYQLTKRGRALLALWREDIAERDLALHSVLAAIDEGLGSRDGDDVRDPSARSGDKNAVARRGRQGPG